MGKEQKIVYDQQWVQDKKDNHQQNLKTLKGFWHGVFHGGSQKKSWLDIYQKRQNERVGAKLYK